VADGIYIDMKNLT
jgi:CCR4-NOT transcription complex subunit 1